MAYKFVNCNGTVSSIHDAFSEIETLAEEMRSNADNMQGTNLESTSKYEATEEAANTLEGVSDVDVPDVVAELPITYSEAVNRDKRKGASRSVRLGNAVAVIEAAVSAAQDWLDDEDNAEHADRDDVEQFVSDAENAADEVRDVEFPGMFG